MSREVPEFDELYATLFPEEAASSKQLVSKPTRLAAVPNVDEFLGARGTKRVKKSFSCSDRAWSVAMVETDAMIKSGDFSLAKPLHAVALFAKFHAEVYGVAPTDLGPKERAKAMAMATHLTTRELNGSVEELLEFVGWSWRKERSKLRWLESTGTPLSFRLSWNFQFSLRKLNDWRVEGHRARATGGR